MSVNKVTLIGNVGQDPIVKQFSSGSKGGQFSLATSDSYTSRSGEKVTNTEWHNISVWGPLADIVEKYIHKGSKIYLEGRLQTRKWTDQNDIERSITEVIASSIQMLDKKQSDTTEQVRDAIRNQAGDSSQPQYDQSDTPTDDFPF